MAPDRKTLIDKLEAKYRIDLDGDGDVDGEIDQSVTDYDLLDQIEGNFHVDLDEDGQTRGADSKLAGKAFGKGDGHLGKETSTWAAAWGQTREEEQEMWGVVSWIRPEEVQKFESAPAPAKVACNIETYCTPGMIEYEYVAVDDTADADFLADLAKIKRYFGQVEKANDTWTKDPDPELMKSVDLDANADCKVGSDRLFLPKTAPRLGDGKSLARSLERMCEKSLREEKELQRLHEELEKSLIEMQKTAIDTYCVPTEGIIEGFNASDHLREKYHNVMAHNEKVGRLFQEQIANAKAKAKIVDDLYSTLQLADAEAAAANGGLPMVYSGNNERRRRLSGQSANSDMLDDLINAATKTDEGVATDWHDEWWHHECREDTDKGLAAKAVVWAEAEERAEIATSLVEIYQQKLHVAHEQVIFLIEMCELDMLGLARRKAEENETELVGGLAQCNTTKDEVDRDNGKVQKHKVEIHKRHYNLLEAWKEYEARTAALVEKFTQKRDLLKKNLARLNAMYKDERSIRTHAESPVVVRLRREISDLTEEIMRKEEEMVRARKEWETEKETRKQNTEGDLDVIFFPVKEHGEKLLEKYESMLDTIKRTMIQQRVLEDQVEAQSELYMETIDTKLGVLDFSSMNYAQLGHYIQMCKDILKGLMNVNEDEQDRLHLECRVLIEETLGIALNSVEEMEVSLTQMVNDASNQLAAFDHTLESENVLLEFCVDTYDPNAHKHQGVIDKVTAMRDQVQEDLLHHGRLLTSSKALCSGLYPLHVRLAHDPEDATGLDLLWTKLKELFEFVQKQSNSTKPLGSKQPLIPKARHIKPKAAPVLERQVILGSKAPPQVHEEFFNSTVESTVVLSCKPAPLSRFVVHRPISANPSPAADRRTLRPVSAAVSPGMGQGAAGLRPQSASPSFNRRAPLALNQSMESDPGGRSSSPTKMLGLYTPTLASATPKKVKEWRMSKDTLTIKSPERFDHQEFILTRPLGKGILPQSCSLPF